MIIIGLAKIVERSYKIGQVFGSYPPSICLTLLYIFVYERVLDIFDTEMKFWIIELKECRGELNPNICLNFVGTDHVLSLVSLSFCSFFN